MGQVLLIPVLTPAVEAWREIGATGQPVFSGTWSNYDTTFNTAAFFKDLHGVVHLKGMVKGGSGTIYTLSAGYRPAMTELLSTHASGGIGRIDITTAGAVVLQAGTNSYVTLDSLSFRAI